jgi:hypothetical protein
MKVALLLTGQLRTNKLCRYLHKNALIDKYDMDVFLSIDKTNNVQNDYLNSTKTSDDDEIQEAVSFYSPVKTFVNESFDEQFSQMEKRMAESQINEVAAPAFLRGVFQQYFVVMKAYELLTSYMEENGVKYDMVIRLRFDQFIWNENEDFSLLKSALINEQSIILYNDENIEKMKNLTQNLKLVLDQPVGNNVYVFGYGDFFHYKYVNDQFFIHDYSLITTFYNFYNEIFDILLDCARTVYPGKGAHYEHVFYKFLINHNITFNRSCVSGIFVRDSHK